MKFLKYLLAITAMVFTFIACQKELSWDSSGVSVGTLAKDGSGSCAPILVNGYYFQDSILSQTRNTMQVTAVVTSPGSYVIWTDSTAGFWFRDSAQFAQPGTYQVTLKGYGKPTSMGTITKVVHYGASRCAADVDVYPAGTTVAVYNLDCATQLVSGTYTVGTATGATNTVQYNINVNTAGIYSISTPMVNGVSFSASGSFATTGPQTVVLTASGTPTANGTHNYTVTGTNCSFPIAVGGGGPAVAIYTLGGAGATCTGATTAGTYTAGTPTTAANTATISVNVTTAGTYSIATTTVNGITFSGTGTFANTGTQTVTLTATGTPNAAGTNTFNVSGAGSTCSFTVTTVGGGGTQAVYTLGGSPAACTGATLAGTYTSGTAMTASNTATITVNVTTAGTYNITTNAANGVTFSKSGTFAATGAQPVTLTASGTPAAAGAFNYTVTGGSSTCTFSVTYAAAVTPADTLTATIDGVQFIATRFFRVRDTIMPAGASYPSYSQLTFGGLNAANDTLYFDIEMDNATATPVGSYDVNMDWATTGKYMIYIFKPVGTQVWAALTDGQPYAPTFAVNLTGNTVGGRIRGTFTGRMYLGGDPTATSVKNFATGYFSIRR